jgi:hypothetical protein
MERQYAPYSKWFGTAFAQLACAKELMPIFDAVLRSGTWNEREGHLSKAYLAALRMHNTLKITGHIEETIQPFYTRPYLVPGSGRVVSALYGVIQSQAVLKLPKNVGAIDQFVNSTDVICSMEKVRKLKGIYSV